MKLVMISIVFIISCVILLTIAAASSDKECIKWKPIPTPTPIPLSSIYSEWVPYPGQAPNTGYGWIRATDFAKAANAWPPKNFSGQLLSDAEYRLIEETHGLLHTYGGKWRYGFQPVQGFPLLYGGVTFKNEWLPKRLQK
tara:strand:- start:61 stop:480 length:420 start_codon:yes stop_codon:yes gene_type:complete